MAVDYLNRSYVGKPIFARMDNRLPFSSVLRTCGFESGGTIAAREFIVKGKRRLLAAGDISVAVKRTTYDFGDRTWAKWFQ
jgi:hypothetical protein